MATCTVTGTLQDVTETPLDSVIVRFRITTLILNSTISVYIPKEVSTSTASDGSFTLTLAQGISGILTIDYPPNSIDSARKYTYSIIIPAASSATLPSLITEL